MEHMIGAKAERGTSSTVRSSPSQLAHPFYVVPVKAVLAMDGLRPHEEVREQLIEWQEGMEVVFFSHTWLNYDHPDHKGQKFALLKSLLERACAGKLDMSTHVQTWIGHGSIHPKASSLTSLAGAYVWIDFMSIPQSASAIEERLAAISCITDYISLSTHFFVLAGPWKHGTDGSVRDVRAWSCRGWCRLELLSNALAPTSKLRPMIVAQSPTDVLAFAPTGLWGRPWFLETVGEGNFP